MTSPSETGKNVVPPEHLHQVARSPSAGDGLYRTQTLPLHERVPRRDSGCLCGRHVERCLDAPTRSAPTLYDVDT